MPTVSRLIVGEVYSVDGKFWGGELSKRGLYLYYRGSGIGVFLGEGKHYEFTLLKLALEPAPELDPEYKDRLETAHTFSVSREGFVQFSENEETKEYKERVMKDEIERNEIRRKHKEYCERMKDSGEILFSSYMTSEERDKLKEESSDMNIYCAKGSNHYATLGIQPGATENEIKKAWYKKTLKCHPDKRLNDKENANEQTKEINYAKETLMGQLGGDPSCKNMGGRKKRRSSKSSKRRSNKKRRSNRRK